MIDYWPLLGVAIITVGMAFRLNTLLVILIAGGVSGFVANMPVMDMLSTLGASFTKNRYMSLFILILPMIGVLERYGLKEVAEDLMKSIKGATAGKVMFLYMLIRKISVALGISLGGHPSMVRPLVAPMAEAAAKKGDEDLSEEKKQKIRALAAASENFGNFFGQNIFVGAGGLLLIKGVLEENGYSISLNDMFIWAIPTAVVSTLIMFVYMKISDKQLEKMGD